MELLIWFWLNDPRWFFNIENSLITFNIILIIPIILNISLCGLFSYMIFYDIIENGKCNDNIIIWIYSRNLICFFMLISSCFMLIKSIYSGKKEKSYFKAISEINPYIDTAIKKYDFWIKRKCIYSTAGIIFLVLSITVLLWVIVILQNSDVLCYDNNINIILKSDMFFVLLSNSPIYIAIISFLLIKVTSAIIAFTCPSILITISNCFDCNRNKINMKYVKTL
jgi:hypothetical protein